MSAASLRGRHPFPAAGEGVVLHFKYSDLATLQDKYKDNWINTLTFGISQFDLKQLSDVIASGAKKDDKPIKVDLNAIDVALDEIVTSVLDGLYLAVFGLKMQDYSDKLQNLRKADEAKSGGGDPLPTGSNLESS